MGNGRPPRRRVTHDKRIQIGGSGWFGRFLAMVLSVIEVPLCPFCGAVARPNILMFGDYDWIALRTEQQEMHLRDWLMRVKKLVVVEVGVGKAIPTLRRFGEANSTRVIRINPRDFSIAARQGVGLAERAAAGLERLDSLLNAS